MTTTVHPHARGAYAVRVVSPGHWPRFIPTHVGHTSSFTFLISSISVHPHARGAYSCPRLIRFLTNGSSPRTWGIHSPFGGYRGYYSVHPHARGAYTTLASCGEHPLRFIPTHVGHTMLSVPEAPAKTGSSPRTWGILGRGASGRRFLRFIPTHVGHTHTKNEPDWLPAGSSPRTWGILAALRSIPAPGRFIPTHVGHTLINVLSGYQRRFIPTHVGHTPVFVVPVVQNPVHPHARGAYLAIGLTSVHSSGSSPRTWGILTLAE